MRPRGEDDLEHWEVIWGGAIAHGHIEALAFDIEELTEEEYAAWRAERAAALARKRQPGFTAPWRNEERSDT